MNIVVKETNEKVFRGVWIPSEIWHNHDLTWMEKCLWAEIGSLGDEKNPCYASNAYLAKMFNSTESSISNMVSKLRSLNMIKDISYDGRYRKIVAVVPTQTSSESEVRLHPEVKSDSTAGLNIDTSIVTKELNKQVNETDRSTPTPTLYKKPKRKLSAPPDEEFISKLKQIHGNIDVDTQLRKMDAWLLSHPDRVRSRAFITNWLNRCTEFKEGYLPNGDIDWSKVKPNE